MSWDYEHIRRFSGTKKITINLFEGNIEGLHSLINWLEGFESSGKTRVPGHLSLVMHFREIMSQLYEEEQLSHKPKADP